VRGGLANRGKRLETLLDLVHGRYRAAGAYVQRNPTPYKVLPHAGPHMRVVPERAAPPDYLVVFQGSAYLIEAKSHAGQRWPLAQLEDHQAAAFDRWQAQGHTFVAGVVLWLDNKGWWVPWSMLAPAWRAAGAGTARRGEHSLDQRWLETHAVSLVGVDWLPAFLVPE
jgi:penicillin-binding protein-related factor A (putative recombinase)